MRFVFLLLPWLELWTLIALGSDIGGFNALLYVFVTLMFGLWLIRRQGEGMVLRVREQMAGYSLGPQLLADEMVMVFSGLLIMVPGLITDVLGLLLMIGPLRRRVFRRLGPQTSTASNGFEKTDIDHENITIEGDFRRLDD
jgi:UPF0716 protein FxsA